MPESAFVSAAATATTTAPTMSASASASSASSSSSSAAAEHRAAPQSRESIKNGEVGSFLDATAAKEVGVNNVDCDVGDGGNDDEGNDTARRVGDVAVAVAVAVVARFRLSDLSPLRPSLPDLAEEVGRWMRKHRRSCRFVDDRHDGGEANGVVSMPSPHCPCASGGADSVSARKATKGLVATAATTTKKRFRGSSSASTSSSSSTHNNNGADSGQENGDRDKERRGGGEGITAKKDAAAHKEDGKGARRRARSKVPPPATTPNKEFGDDGEGMTAEGAGSGVAVGEGIEGKDSKDVVSKAGPQPGRQERAAGCPSGGDAADLTDDVVSAEEEDDDDDEDGEDEDIDGVPFSGSEDGEDDDDDSSYEGGKDDGGSGRLIDESLDGEPVGDSDSDSDSDNKDDEESSSSSESASSYDDGKATPTRASKLVEGRGREEREGKQEGENVSKRWERGEEGKSDHQQPQSRSQTLAAGASGGQSQSSGSRSGGPPGRRKIRRGHFVGLRADVLSGTYRGLSGRISQSHGRGWMTVDHPDIPKGKKIGSGCLKIYPPDEVESGDDTKKKDRSNGANPHEDDDDLDPPDDDDDDDGDGGGGDDDDENGADQDAYPHPYIGRLVSIVSGRYSGMSGRVLRQEARGWWTLDCPGLPPGKKVGNRQLRALEDVPDEEIHAYNRATGKICRKLPMAGVYSTLSGRSDVMKKRKRSRAVTMASEVDGGQHGSGLLGAGSGFGTAGRALVETDGDDAAAAGGKERAIHALASDPLDDEDDDDDDEDADDDDIVARTRRRLRGGHRRRDIRPPPATLQPPSSFAVVEAAPSDADEGVADFSGTNGAEDGTSSCRRASLEVRRRRMRQDAVATTTTTAAAAAASIVDPFHADRVPDSWRDSLATSGASLRPDYFVPPRCARYRRRTAPSRVFRPPLMPPVLLHRDDDVAVVPETLRHLPPDFKVDIFDRSTGRIRTGPDAIPARELPAVLRRHAEYEPIVPPPLAIQATAAAAASGTVLALAEATREGRSASTQPLRVNPGVLPQPKIRGSACEGREVAVTAGPYRGLVGKVEACLPGGWYLVSDLLEDDDHELDVVISSRHLQLLERVPENFSSPTLATPASTVVNLSDGSHPQPPSSGPPPAPQTGGDADASGNDIGLAPSSQAGLSGAEGSDNGVPAGALDNMGLEGAAAAAAATPTHDDIKQINGVKSLPIKTLRLRIDALTEERRAILKGLGMNEDDDADVDTYASALNDAAAKRTQPDRNMTNGKGNSNIVRSILADIACGAVEGEVTDGGGSLTSNGRGDKDGKKRSAPLNGDVSILLGGAGGVEAHRLRNQLERVNSKIKWTQKELESRLHPQLAATRV